MLVNNNQLSYIKLVQVRIKANLQKTEFNKIIKLKKELKVDPTRFIDSRERYPIKYYPFFMDTIRQVLRDPLLSYKVERMSSAEQLFLKEEIMEAIPENPDLYLKIKQEIQMDYPHKKDVFLKLLDNFISKKKYLSTNYVREYEIENIISVFDYIEDSQRIELVEKIFNKVNLEEWCGSRIFFSSFSRLNSKVATNYFEKTEKVSEVIKNSVKSPIVGQDAADQIFKYFNNIQHLFI
ncbi:hypothetical protein ACFLZV_00980, partial [Candidatus Margulisiibacteriota bacterium]